ncbi:Beta-galactosidase [Kluyvera cryocrescens]|uniref:beta-galactosidase n=1 Tax=Kluyvera cryocrescens TaxID=580 RepID=A0A485AWA7_KLUCR|nr:Beta-galactosidase [Kluyvera cryocrescens]
MSGIFRDVSLQHKPATHISDLRINTHFNDDFSRAALETQVRVAGELRNDLRVTVQLWDNDTLIGENTGSLGSEIIDERGAYHDRITLRQNVKEPALWSAETPNLLSGRGEVTHRGRCADRSRSL